MREAAERCDDVAMVLGVVELVVVAERREQQQRLVLVVEILAVLERHVEELSLARVELLVEAPGDRRLGDRRAPAHR